ncbi:MAG: MBL fold metallo-hydrolase [Clostridia bacterium]|nr:MBL fold metallo-hydrolase [Clostridia bacterium]
MNNIRILSLYSGSTGNAFLITSPVGTLLIDAGKSARQLLRALDEAHVDPAQIGAILLTHEHNDHISALSVFLKKHPIPVHLPQGCVYKLEGDPAIAPHLCPHPPIDTAELCGMRVTSFPTPHDSRASVGYRIEIPYGDTTIRVGYATDIGYVSPAVEEGLLGCDAVILESNHDLDMLMNGIYPYQLKQRVASRRGHLSNPDSAYFASRLCANGTKSLMLAHLSQENNTPDTAYSECIGAVANTNVNIAVACPDRITEMLL